MASPATDAIHVGVDGGGTGTRVAVSTSQGRRVVVVKGGPSALSKGSAAAWDTIAGLVGEACRLLDIEGDWRRCFIAAGMAGAHHVGWRSAFEQAAPPVRQLVVETDAHITLLGAHEGQRGAIVAVGTGCVGESWDGGTVRRSVGGFGFPAGDEAGGSWFGLQASRHVQRVMDGRARPDDFARALLEAMEVSDRDALTAWLTESNATRYASLAPVVFDHAEHPVAAALIEEAVRELERLASALDPEDALPLALCGSVGERLRAFLPAPLASRWGRPAMDAVRGALRLARSIAA